MTMPSFEAIAWPEDMKPSRVPIHFTNEIETTASVDTVWLLLTRPDYWPRFYPGVTKVVLPDGGDTLQQGTHFKTNLAGQDVAPVVAEFEPKSRLAWGGTIANSSGSKAHHAWILTPTAGGCHIWTEETMRGPLWLDLARDAPDRYWLAHEWLLKDLAAVAETLDPSTPA